MRARACEREFGNPLAERVVRVGAGEQEPHGLKALGDGERGAPLLLQDVEADGTAVGDVAVVDGRLEEDRRWLELEA